MAVARGLASIPAKVVSTYDSHPKKEGGIHGVAASFERTVHRADSL